MKRKSKIESKNKSEDDKTEKTNQHKEEIYSKTVDKLTWICHMSNRSVRENYLKGIEAFGIIETFTNEFGVIKWRWIGIKALKNNGGE